MEVRINSNVDPVGLPPVRAHSPRPASVASDTAEFDQAAQLEQGLNGTPEVRSEVVQRGQGLVGDVAYPPIETLKRIATLLALEMNKDPY